MVDVENTRKKRKDGFDQGTTKIIMKFILL